MRILLIILAASLLLSCNSSDRMITKVNTSNNTLSITYNGTERVIGGSIIRESTVGYSLQNNDKNGFTFTNNSDEYTIKIIRTSHKNIIGFCIDSLNSDAYDGQKFIGLFFESIPNYKQGIQIWRYKPWNSWTKPIKTASPSELQDWDVQFFYWQYTDGTYGAAVPLSGNGFRTTLGTADGNFGAKALTNTKGQVTGKLPLIAFGFGDDPYILFEEIYAASLEMMGKQENLRSKKEYPEIMDYFGWCSWNSSGNGNNLNEKLMVDAAESFHSNNFPLKWMIIDDGWSQNTSSQLDSYLPIAHKFPNGFKPMIEKLKRDHGIKYVGAWHAFNGYWAGINKDSDIGIEYKDVLYQYIDYNPMIENDPGKECYMINPYSHSMETFYNNWHQWMVEQGVDFVKVDNQLAVERMAKNNFPIWDMAENMHVALYKSIDKYFSGTVINCMNMTNDAFYNFGTSAVARTVEDYFPYKEHETYNLQEGNAAAHVTQALYNTSYFQQMVWPDFDMFESYNPNAAYHAIARAISGGPIYVTDIPGKQNFDVLFPLVFSDGKIIRADVPGRLTYDCLFQVQDAAPLKAYSFANGTGLLGIWNAADTNVVKGTFKVSDIEGIEGEKFALYEHFSQQLLVVGKNDSLNVELNRMAYKYYNAVPIVNNMAIIGLVNKYNAPKTISSINIIEKTIEIELFEGGNFMAYLENKPEKVFLNGFEIANYTYHQNTFQLYIPQNNSSSITLNIEW